MNSASPKKKRTPKSKSKEPGPTRLKVIVVGPSDLPKSERKGGYAVILGDCVHPGLILGRSVDREEANKAATEWCRRYGLGPPFLMSDDDVLTQKFLNVLKGDRSEPPKAHGQQVRGTPTAVWESSPDLHRTLSSARLAMSEASTAISKGAAKLEALEGHYVELLQIVTRLVSATRTYAAAYDKCSAKGPPPKSAPTLNPDLDDADDGGESGFPFFIEYHLGMFDRWFGSLEPEFRMGFATAEKEEEA